MTRIEQARARARWQRDAEASVRLAIDGLLAVEGRRPAELLQMVISVAAADLAAVRPPVDVRR